MLHFRWQCLQENAGKDKKKHFLRICLFEFNFRTYFCILYTYSILYNTHKIECTCMSTASTRNMYLNITKYGICQQNLPTQMVRKLFCDSFFCAINQNLQKSVDGKIMNCLGSKRKKYFTHLKCQCHEIVWHEFNPPGPQDSFSPGLGIRSF